MSTGKMPEPPDTLTSKTPAAASAGGRPPVRVGPLPQHGLESLARVGRDVAVQPVVAFGEEREADPVLHLAADAQVRHVGNQLLDLGVRQQAERRHGGPFDAAAHGAGEV